MATTTPSSVPAAVKVLVTGPPTKLSSYFSKLGTLQAKHSFDLVLALDLFSGLPDDDLELAQLMAGVIEVPKDVQLYAISGGKGAVPNKVREAVKGGGQVTERLSFLGKTGVLTLASGLRLATFAGSYEPELFKATEQDPDADLVDPLSTAHFTSTDLESFRSLLTPAQRLNSSLPPKPIPTPDILLTTSLPASLPLLSALALPATAKGQPFSSELDEVVRMSRPRYHFIGGTGIFWEREPFQWNDGSKQVCRSICLGEMGAKGKERAFYAFSIVPGGPPPNPLPPSMTPSPYSIDSSNSKRGTKRPAGSLDQNNGTNEYGVPNYIFGAGGKNGNNKRGRNGADGGERRPPPEHYTCNICEQKGHWIQDCPEKVERDAQRAAARAGAGGGSMKPIQPDECWFCLSNPKVTKHLIASIGSETYLTLPKGQLCPTGPNGEPNEKSPVPGGGHVLIIPVRTTTLGFRLCNELTSSLWSTLQIAHYPTLLSVPADQAVPIVAEIERYKSALKTCYAAFGASPVAFEVGRLSGKGGHAHIQICPIPNALLDKVEQVFIDQGQNQNVTFKEASSSSLSSEGLRKLGISDNYFRVDLPNGKTLVHSIEQGTRFGLQFGREALAVLMELPERSDWKACSKNEQMEKKECVAFKKAFKNFDPME